MARSLDRPDIVDVSDDDFIGEMQLDIQSVIDSKTEFNTMGPIMFSVVYMKSPIVLQIILQHNNKTDMVEAFLEVLSIGSNNNLDFKINYGIDPFLLYRSAYQTLLYTTKNTRTKAYGICDLTSLINFMVKNEYVMERRIMHFVSRIIISRRDIKTRLSKFKIPKVNDDTCDHRIVCGCFEIKAHSQILMRASKFFQRKLSQSPFNVTVINRLDKSKRIEKEVLTVLLRFMYGLNISEHNLRTTSLLHAAKEYEVDKLFEICESSMIKQLDEEKAIEMAPELLYIGKSENASRLSFAAANYILKNYDTVMKGFQWKAASQLFKKFFETVKPNPRKYLREIVTPHIRSKSTGDMTTSFSFLHLSPRITRPIPAVIKDEASIATTSERDTETTSEGETRGSQDTSLYDFGSMDYDLEPVPRRRSSPVITRRRSESVSLPGSPAFRMKSLGATLPRIKFSRESLKQKLLANELKFEDSFGPVESSSTRFLERSVSLPTEFQKRSESMPHKRSDKVFGQPDFDVAMEVSEDSNLESFDESEDSSNSPDSMAAGNLSGARPDLSSPSLKSMRSLEFGYTYSYSSDSVFERESPKSMSKVLTPAQDMSVSEVSSRFHDISASPRAVKRIDFEKYAHPAAASLSDVSSIPRDHSSSYEPESSSSSRSKSRRGKRMKKMADKTRKYLPSPTSSSLPFDFSSTEDSTSIGIIPRPAFSKEKTEKGQSSSKFHQKKGIRKDSGSDSSSSENAQPKKVTFGDNVDIPPYVDYEEFDEPELEETRYYDSWIDTATFYRIQGVFDEPSSIYTEHEDVEFGEKPWDEKNEEELTGPLLQKKRADPAPSSSSPRDSAIEYKNFKKDSSSSSYQSSVAELPIGGGVRRKDAGRFKTAYVDDPMPLSSSESVGTTSSSISSTERNKVKKVLTGRYSTSETKSNEPKTDEASNLLRSQSFIDLNTAGSTSDLQQRRTISSVAGVYSFGPQEGHSQQPIQERNIQKRKETKQKQESGTVDSKPEAEKDDQ